MVVLFDLDGTLTDSGEGITKCAQLALDHVGSHIEDRTQLRCFVGPPLRESFPKFGVPENRVEEAIAVFRSRYLTVGKFENVPYSGIAELLGRLKAHGHRLYVATSKPESTAVEILDKFELSPYFTRICGASMDSGRDSKEAVIAYLLELEGCREKTVMVGDTAFDVIGAAAHQIPTIGVSWGYGDVGAMLEAGAVAIAHSTEELEALLTQEMLHSTTKIS